MLPLPRTRHPLPLASAIAALSTLLLASLLLSISVGAIPLPISAILTHSLDPIQTTILTQVRLPRVLASAVIGAALAVAGLLFQGLFRNPMADPYIIGASGGAGLGAALGIIFFSQVAFLGFSATALLGFIGSVLTMALVYGIARTHGRTSSITLLLAGFALGALLANVTQLLIVFDPNNSSLLPIVQAWLLGSVGIPPWTQLAVASSLLAVALVLAYPLMRRLNTLALGDEYADQLGIRVELTRACIILVGSLLTALAVSLGGLIAFAGLIIPHVARMLLGPDHIRLLPVTALGGAIFLVVADTLARTLFRPTEIPVGLLMVCLGAPFFLYLLRKQRSNYTL